MRTFDTYREAISEIRRDISKAPVITSGRVQQHRIAGRMHEATNYGYTILRGGMPVSRGSSWPRRSERSHSGRSTGMPLPNGSRLKRERGTRCGCWRLPMRRVSRTYCIRRFPRSGRVTPSRTPTRIGSLVHAMRCLRRWSATCTRGAHTGQSSSQKTQFERGVSRESRARWAIISW